MPTLYPELQQNIYADLPEFTRPPQIPGLIDVAKFADAALKVAARYATNPTPSEHDQATGEYQKIAQCLVPGSDDYLAVSHIMTWDAEHEIWVPDHLFVRYDTMINAETDDEVDSSRDVVVDLPYERRQIQELHALREAGTPVEPQRLHERVPFAAPPTLSDFGVSQSEDTLLDIQVRHVAEQGQDTIPSVVPMQPGVPLHIAEALAHVQDWAQQHPDDAEFVTRESQNVEPIRIAIVRKDTLKRLTGILLEIANAPTAS